METVKVGPVTVSQLNDYLKQRLDQDEALRLVCVEGEISNYTDHSSGHLYFSLKDKDAAIKAVMFRGYRQKLTFRPGSGMKVIVVGDVSFYSKAGTVQLYVQHMFPSGIGDVYADFEALKRKLADEGLFDPGHKKKIPAYPEKIGVVTSPTGAAIRDIRNVLSRRYPLARILLKPVTVQGSAAPEEMIRALHALNQDEACDVILLARGGGSLEDLSVFNDEGLARAIYASRIPIITGIGHEIDYTIADYVADLRAPTPSAAAELAVPDQKDLMLFLAGMEDRMGELIGDRLHEAQEMLQAWQTHSQQIMGGRIERENQRVRLFEERLQSRMSALMHAAWAQMEKSAALLQGKNPLARFQGGFVYAEAEGYPLESIAQLKTGGQVQIWTLDGKADVTVQTIERKQLL